jgi:predicted transposase YbfD/YdcC
VAVLVTAAANWAQACGDGLLACFERVPDPRDPRGRRHGLASILGLCTAAVLAGEVDLDDITAWVGAAPQELLAAMGCRRNRLGVHVAPHPDTIERVFAALAAQDLADQVGAHLARRAVAAHAAAVPSQDGPVLLPGLAVDGKAIRGAVGTDGAIPYLLAAATHENATVLAERAIGPKSNEVPQFAPLLRGLAQVMDLTGWVVTMDAGHTVRAHARLVVGELLAHYVMVVKENTKRLYERLDALDWNSVPVGHVSVETGHGRWEKRTIQVMDAPDDIDFPHAGQVFLIERTTVRTVYRRDKNSKKVKKTKVKHCVAVLGITSLTAAQAAPEHLATYVRQHWSIENKIHWVRDVTFREDASRVRTDSRPRIMTTLRNLAIGLLRQAGYTRIAATIRKIRHDPRFIYALLGLTATSETTT